jgi:hypothetical protein
MQVELPEKANGRQVLFAVGVPFINNVFSLSNMGIEKHIYIYIHTGWWFGTFLVFLYVLGIR